MAKEKVTKASASTMEPFETGGIDPGKLKALSVAMEKIEKDFGKGAIMALGQMPAFDGTAIHSGSILLDEALGIGGYPRGRVIEIFGPESSGKTTLAIHAMAEIQRGGGIAAIIDAEHAFDRFYAEKLGVDVGDRRGDGRLQGGAAGASYVTGLT